MLSDYQKNVHRRAQCLMIVAIGLLFSTAGVVAACVAFDRQLERAALIDQERVQW